MVTASQFYDRRVRPDYFGPACNDACRVGVGIRSVAAGQTRENIARLPVALLDVATNAALPRRIAWIDTADRKPSTRGLVEDLRLKISESPRMQDLSPLPASPYPIANAIEILHGDSAIGAFGCSDNLLRDAVIHMVRETPLLCSTLAKQAFRASCFFELEFATQAIRPTTQPIQLPSREVLAIAGARDIRDAHIDTEPSVSLAFLGVGNVDGDEQEELALAMREVRLSAIEGEELPLMFATYERHSLATIDGPNVRGFPTPREDALVVTDRPKGSENMLRVPIKFVAVGDLRDAPDYHLRRQIRERCPRIVVGEFVQGELRKRLRAPRPTRQPITHLVSAAKCGEKRGGLFGCGLQLHLHSELHVCTVTRFQRLSQSLRVGKERWL